MLEKALSRPKFESLPKGLKEKAEELINKKFGIKKYVGVDYGTQETIVLRNHDLRARREPAYMGIVVNGRCQRGCHEFSIVIDTNFGQPMCTAVREMCGDRYIIEFDLRKFLIEEDHYRMRLNQQGKVFMRPDPAWVSW